MADQHLVRGGTDRARGAVRRATASRAVARRRWTAPVPTRGRPGVRRTPDGRRSTGRHSSRRPPPSQRAAGLQVVHLRVEQLVLHEQLADLGVQPLVLLIPGIRRAALQPRLARSQELVTPLRGPRRRDPQFPRHRLEIFAPQQAEYRRAFTPGRKPPPPVTLGGRSRRPPGRSPAAVDSSTCFLISTLLLRELSRNQVSKKTLGRRNTRHLSVSNSLSDRHWELDQVPAVGDPTDIVQFGTGHHVAAGEGRRRVALQRRVAAYLVVGGQTPGATQRGLNPGFSERIGNSRRTGEEPQGQGGLDGEIRVPPLPAA